MMAGLFCDLIAEKTKATLSDGFCIIWHLASFPQSSIIAATGLDFCVRNGNRYFPSAMGTKYAPRGELMSDYTVKFEKLLAGAIRAPIAS
jgi:hypothetical protein